MERRKKEEEDKRLREQTVMAMVIHPYTGEQMMLNHDQRVKFFQDLPHMRADQFPPKGTASAEEQDPTVQTSLPTKHGSFIASVSAEENVGYFKNMRRECQVKTFDGYRTIFLCL